MAGVHFGLRAGESPRAFLRRLWERYLEVSLADHAAELAFALLFASSYFSTITPQGGSQNVIFVGSGYLTQGELYRLGALTTAFCLLVFLVLGTPWLLMIGR